MMLKMKSLVLGLQIVSLCLIEKLLMASAGNIKWEESSKTVQQGDTFSMKCILSDMRRMDLVRLVKENQEEDTQKPISDSSVVKSPFVETNRYSVSVDRKAKTVTLSFTGVRGEDGGRIGCHKLVDDPEIAWVDLKVNVPIEDLYIASRDDKGQEKRVNHKDEMVDLREEHEDAAICKATVSGSLTPPTLRVLVDGEDKTAMFNAQPKSEAKPNDGLPTYSSEMMLVYSNLKPDASFNGKSFVCEGEMEGFEKVTAEAIFMVEYRPIVTCSKYEHYATLGSPMTLACDVQSNPPATVSWAWGADKQLNSGMADEANHLTAEEKPLEASDKKEVNLEISEVTQDHLGSYTLTAKNDYGEKSITLELKKASAAPPKPKPNQVESKGQQGGVKDPQSVTGGGVSVGFSLWSLLVSLPLSIVIFITVT